MQGKILVISTAEIEGRDSIAIDDPKVIRLLARCGDINKEPNSIHVKLNPHPDIEIREARIGQQNIIDIWKVKKFNTLLFGQYIFDELKLATYVIEKQKLVLVRTE